MGEADIVDELLDRWESAEPKPTPEALCDAHPHLLEEVRRRILLLAKFHAFANIPTNTSVADASMPKRIGKYEVLERLGHGGMGEVHKAREDGTGRLVAIKVVRADRGASREWLRRFRWEVRVHSTLDPNHNPKFFVDDGALVIGTRNGNAWERVP